MPRMTLESTSPDQTRDLARQIAGALRPGDLVLLRGMLGAGKTTLIRALVEALGVPPAEVSSPTFVIASSYTGVADTPIVHMDAYRLAGDTEELDQLGWDLFAASDSIVLIEWADRIGHLLHREGLWIEIEHIGETERRFTLTIPDAWADRGGALWSASRPQGPATCPITGEPVSLDNPHYPFSSERARWADLYRWFSESYQVDRPAEQADFDEHL
jgi:tRNA threonylcarbamoyladenosine biosynthesis protein TsaE